MSVWHSALHSTLTRTSPAFGGATIDCPWATLRRLKAKLEDDERCDLVVPLQHTYVPDDHRTCREFDVPVVLSGHDHPRVDEVVACCLEVHVVSVV